MSLTRRKFIATIGSTAALAAVGCLHAGKPSAGIPGEKPVASLEHPLASNKRIKLLFHFYPTQKNDRKMRAAMRVFNPHVVCLDNLRPDAHILNKAAGKRTLQLEPLSEPELKSVLDKHSEAFDLQAEALHAVMQGEAEKAVEIYQRYLSTAARLHVQRETLAKEALDELYKHLTKKFPDLASEPEVRVLVNFGRAHTAIAHYARKGGFKKSTIHLRRPTYFYPDEVYLRSWGYGIRPDAGKRGKLEKPNSHDAMARRIIGTSLASMANGMGVNHSNSAAFANLASEKVDFTLFKRVSKRASKLLEETVIGPEEAIMQALREQNIVVPESKKQVHNFLAKRRVKLARE